jgi:hypothetical protein
MTGPQQAEFDLLEEITTDGRWPGIADYWFGFRDTIFGRYKTMEELNDLETAMAEEETEEYMDATADDPPVHTAGSEVSSTDLETEHEPEDGGAISARPDLPLIDITVRS